MLLYVTTFSVPSSGHGSGTYRRRLDIRFSLYPRTPDVKATTQVRLVIVAFASQHYQAGAHIGVLGQDGTLDELLITQLLQAQG